MVFLREARLQPEKEVSGGPLHVEIQYSDPASTAGKGKSRHDRAHSLAHAALGGAESNDAAYVGKPLGNDGGPRITHTHPSLSSTSRLLIRTPLPF